MPSDSIRILPVLHFETVPVSPRSRLFGVRPIGAGTSAAEAITSLVTEIANRHHVRADRLVELLGDTVALRTATEARRRLRSLHLETFLNGCGSRAARFVAGVEELTGVSGLASHTMLPWAQTLPTHGLIRPSAAWCSACLAGDREAVGRPYLRLLWQLQPVQVCIDHRCLLSDLCPGCARRVPPFPGACLAGHCPHCGSRLADGPIRRPPQQEEGWLSWAAVGVDRSCRSRLQIIPPSKSAPLLGASRRPSTRSRTVAWSCSPSGSGSAGGRRPSGAPAWSRPPCPRCSACAMR